MHSEKMSTTWLMVVNVFVQLELVNDFEIA